VLLIPKHKTAPNSRERTINGLASSTLFINLEEWVLLLLWYALEPCHRTDVQQCCRAVNRRVEDQTSPPFVQPVHNVRTAMARIF